MTTATAPASASAPTTSTAAPIEVTPEQRFFLDTQGYLVVPGVLDAAQVQRMLADMDTHGVNPPTEENSDNYRFGDFLRWSEDYRSLIDHPKILPLLHEMLGNAFRLDHAYGMASRTTKTGEPQPVTNNGRPLHHSSYLFDYGCFYLHQGKQMHNGLIVVSYALTDIAEGAGGFCCMPGSHKANFPMPQQWYGLEGNPLVKQIPQKAGDALIFTESLTHGTWPWRDKAGQRRSVLMKYCPGYMQWAQGPMDSNIDGLTDRQKAILRGAYVWQRPRF
jgi:ectoine hydroxylase-related dioxygenase (phytanoyl-CoA dioxygenase family)